MAVNPIFSIDANSSALTTLGFLNSTSVDLANSLARLSSGLRIVSPADDPGGLAQSITLSAQASRATAASTVITNATSFSNSQNSFLTQVQSSLTQLSDLAVSAQSGTATPADISTYTTEFVQLQNFISDVGNKQFNGINLFGGQGLSVITGGDSSNTFNLTPIDLANASPSVGLASAYDTSAVTIGTAAAAASAQSVIATAIQTVGMMIANVGSNVERLNLTNDSQTSLATNLTNASNAITKVDLPTEIANFSQLSLLQQTQNEALAQELLLPQLSLNLLTSLPKLG